MHPTQVEPILTDDDILFYRTDKGELLPSHEMLHLRGLSTNGYKGKSPIAVHRDNLSLTASAQQYGEKFFNQGGNMSGVFKYPSTLKPEALFISFLEDDSLSFSNKMKSTCSALYPYCAIVL